MTPNRKTQKAPRNYRGVFFMGAPTTSPAGASFAYLLLLEIFVIEKLHKKSTTRILIFVQYVESKEISV